MMKNIAIFGLGALSMYALLRLVFSQVPVMNGENVDYYIYVPKSKLGDFNNFQ